MRHRYLTCALGIPQVGAPFGAPCTVSQILPLHLGSSGCPLHHPLFLEWIGGPESARLLDRGTDAWFRSLSCMQSINAVRHIHRDVFLMTSNLNILDQYVLCLQGTATKLLELILHRRDFPSAAVVVATPLPCVRRAPVHMEVMGLWRTSLDPVIRSWPPPRSDIDITGSTACSPCVVRGWWTHIELPLIVPLEFTAVNVTLLFVFDMDRVHDGWVLRAETTCMVMFLPVSHRLF